MIVQFERPTPPTPAPTTGLVVANGLLIVPGTPDQTVRLHFRWISREAAFDNEVGLFVTDGAGRINNLGPADAGYGAAGLNSPTRQVLFASGQGAGAVADVTLRGGDRVALYLAQNGTTARAAAGQIPAFFTAPAANPFGAVHARIGAVSANTIVYRWEDLIRGDDDFNDVVMSATVVGETAALLGSGVFQAAGGPRRTGVFTLLESEAAFRNEVGFFPVDDAGGRIGGLLPSDAGYTAAALAAAQVLFASGTKAIVEAERALPDNGLFGLYLVSDGTTDEARRGRKTAFLSLAAANPGRLAHLRADTGGAFGFEDQIDLGDADFNDAVIRVGVR
jgi:hypothetical protein